MSTELMCAYNYMHVQFTQLHNKKTWLANPFSPPWILIMHLINVMAPLYFWGMGSSKY